MTEIIRYYEPFIYPHPLGRTMRIPRNFVASIRKHFFRQNVLKIARVFINFVAVVLFFPKMYCVFFASKYGKWIHGLVI